MKIADSDFLREFLYSQQRVLSAVWRLHLSIVLFFSGPSVSMTPIHLVLRIENRSESRC